MSPKNHLTFPNKAFFSLKQKSVDTLSFYKQTGLSLEKERNLWDDFNQYI